MTTQRVRKYKPDRELITWKKQDEKMIDRNIQQMVKAISGGDAGLFSIQPYAHILASALSFEGIEDIETKRGLIVKTARQLPTFKKQDFPTFRRSLAARIRRYLKEPEREYQIIFPLNIDSHSLGRRRRFNVLGVKVRICGWNSIAKRFDIPKWLTKSKRYNLGLTTKFIPLLVTARGRDWQSVFREANDTFCLLRAVLNLPYTFDRASIQFGEPQPLGRILPPPVYGVFDNKGSYLGYYFETGIRHEYKVARLEPRAIRIVDRTLRLLKPANDSEDTACLVVDALRKYGRALETTDWRDAFLSLWQVLELLTFRPTERFDMRTVCKRIKALLDNDLLLSDLLSTAYVTRNELVHRGLFSEEQGLTDVTMLKIVVEHCINAILSKQKAFPTWERLQLFYSYAPRLDRHLNDSMQTIKTIQASRKTSRQ